MDLLTWLIVGLIAGVLASLVMGGTGYGLIGDIIIALPPETMQHHLDAGTLVQLQVDLGLRMDAYGIITRKQHRLSPGAQAMLDVLRALV